MTGAPASVFASATDAPRRPSATTLGNGTVLVVGGNAAGLDGSEAVAMAETLTP